MNYFFLQKTFSPFLYPLSLSYSWILHKRRQWYAGKQYKTLSPCVSVGNIAAGGTGKTPVIDWLLTWAEKKSLCAGVLSRGYGGKPGDVPVFVTPKTSPLVSGDEPLMLAKNHPKAQIVVHPKRIHSAKLLEQQYSPDIILLDDGMQHLAIARDADIVLLRAEDFKEWNNVMPFGIWREDARSLSCATVFLIKCDAEAFNQLLPAIEDKLGQLNVPIFSFTLEPTVCRPLNSESNKKFILGGEYDLFTGIGNPAQVQVSVQRLMGSPPRNYTIFPDHHAYTEKDLYQIIKKADGRQVLCTEKDAVKLIPFKKILEKASFFVLLTRLSFGSYMYSDCGFPEWWESWWKKRQGSSD